MSEKMKAFLEALSKDKELFDKLNAIPFATEEEKIQKAIAFAKDELGVELTEADLKQPEPAKGELSDDELNAVAGGDVCFCAAGGGGTSGGAYTRYIKEDYRNFDESTCACVLGGYGEYSMNGRTYERCYCAVGGSGNCGWYEYEHNDG